MKKIILFVIIVIIIVAVLGIILLFNNEVKMSYYPDSEGWDRKALQGDEFESLFPLVLGENLYLESPDAEGFFGREGLSAPSTAFIEYRNNAQIDLGTAEKERILTVLSARRSFYSDRTFKEMPVFKIWAERVSPEEFLEYKLAILDLLNSYPASVSGIEKASYKDHEYYIYLRRDLTKEGLKGLNSIGGVYIFFPEKNTGMFIFLFNTSNKSNTYMISHYEIINIIHGIIDYAVR